MNMDEFDTSCDNNFGNDTESMARTRRIALFCGIAGCVMMTISIVGLMF